MNKSDKIAAYKEGGFPSDKRRVSNGTGLPEQLRVTQLQEQFVNLINQKPEEVVQLIRTWLAETDELVK